MNIRFVFALGIAATSGIDAWARPKDLSGISAPSFVYGGHPFSEFTAKWPEKLRSRRLGQDRTEVTQVWRDPVTGLEVRSVAVRYGTTVIENTVYVKNLGAQDTPIIEGLRTLDLTTVSPGDQPYVLHHNVGAPADGTDYRPLETTLTPFATTNLSGAGGRPTNSDLCYFNLSHGNSGTIFAVGWPGQWDASFGLDPQGGVHCSIGQQGTHFKLHPGEEVRTPMVVRLSWTGDWIDGQNQWRRWMEQYAMPRVDGKLPQPMMLGYTGRTYTEMTHATEANQIMSIDRYLEEGFKLDTWWMDAGWYIQDTGWHQTGTWEVDPKRFPRGLKPISDHAHAHGIKTMLWFEPERVAANTWLWNRHPEWLLSTVDSLLARRSSKLGGDEPFVISNSSDRAVDWHGIHWAPHELSLHPGSRGEYSVVRFTAPADGEYRLKATFQAIDPLATTDIHVLQGGTSLHDSFINLQGKGNRDNVDVKATLRGNDTVDFVVGFGNGTLSNDATGLDASIIGPNGQAFDAAADFGKPNSAWSYGFLSAGSTPDSRTFVAYDRNEKGIGNDDRLLDLGNPTAWKWLVNRIDQLLKDNRIDIYRQDFNMDPLPEWRAQDADDRQGITENKYVVGYLAFWDELRRRNPALLIDSCASGGRRNDLETMRRAVPLWRSDYHFEPTGQQSMTYGISTWLPYYGTGTVANGSAPWYAGGVLPVIPYDFWSTACPSLMSAIDIQQRGYDYDALRRLWNEWRELGPYYYGDYYPLTPFSPGNDSWIAWQFNCRKSGDGFIQAFRRPDAKDAQVILQLRGLEPDATYRLSVLDGNKVLDGVTLKGRELMDGVAVSSSGQPEAEVVIYRRVKR